MNETEIQEVFAPPIFLKKIAVMAGMELFTSEGLKKRFLKAMSKSPQLKPAASSLATLVESERLIPCFLSSNRKEWKIFKKYYPDSGKKKRTLAFYVPHTQQIYVLMDSHVNWLGFSPNQILTALVRHESMHMAAHQRPTVFFTIFQDQLEKFYLELFRIILDIDESAPIKVFTKKLFQSEIKLNRKKVVSIYEKEMNGWVKYSKTDKKDFEQRLKFLSTMIRLATHNSNAFISNIRLFRPIIKSIIQAYEKAFGFRPLGKNAPLPFQELFAPSEVIAICAEFTDNPRIISAIKKLA